MISVKPMAVALLAALSLPCAAQAATPHDFSIFAIRMGGDSAQAKPYIDRFARHLETTTGWPASSVNGGFFVLNRSVLEYIDDDDTVWEQAPLEKLAREGELSAYKHRGFWQPMDTLRDRNRLEELWQAGDPPWRLWQ